MRSQFCHLGTAVILEGLKWAKNPPLEEAGLSLKMVWPCESQSWMRCPFQRAKVMRWQTSLDKKKLQEQSAASSMALSGSEMSPSDSIRL